MDKPEDLVSEYLTNLRYGLEILRFKQKPQTKKYNLRDTHSLSEELEFLQQTLQEVGRITHTNISSLVLCDETSIAGITRNPRVKAFYAVDTNSYYISLNYLINHVDELAEVLIEGYHVAGMNGTLTTYTNQATQINLLVSKQRYEPESIEA